LLWFFLQPRPTNPENYPITHLVEAFQAMLWFLLRREWEVSGGLLYRVDGYSMMVDVPLSGCGLDKWDVRTSTP